MSNSTVLEPGMRLCIPPGSVAHVEAGAVDARAVAYQNGAVHDAGMFLTAVPAGGLAIALGDPVRVELVADVHANVSITPLIDAIAAEALTGWPAWLRTVDTVGAWIPFAAPKALFPGRLRLKHDDIVAAPRECVVWIRLDQGWWPLSDGAPVRWDGPAEIEVMAAIPSDALPTALSQWAAVTSLRLGHLLTSRETARVSAMASDGEAAQTVSRATRDAIAGIRDLYAGEPGRPIAQRVLTSRRAGPCTAASAAGAGAGTWRRPICELCGSRHHGRRNRTQ